MFSWKKYILILMSFVLLLMAAACSRDPGSSSSGEGPANFPTLPNGGTTTHQQTTEPTTTEPLAYYDFEPKTTGVFLTRSGEIRSAEVTPFDNSGFEEPRYDVEGLRSFVQETVDTYNTAKNSIAVSIHSLEVISGVASLVLSYDSLESFMDFQGSEFGIKQLKLTNREDAIRNYDIRNLVDTTGKHVDLLEAFRGEDILVLVISGKTSVTVNGNIYYLSQNLDVTGVNSVRCDDDVNLSFIIFR